MRHVVYRGLIFGIICRSRGATESGRCAVNASNDLALRDEMAFELDGVERSRTDLMLVKFGYTHTRDYRAAAICR